MNRFSLAYREQQQLFLFDRSYVAATLLKVGGVSTLLARFVVQFFWNPAIAVTLTVCLLTLSSYLLWLFVRESRKDWWSAVLCIVPSCIMGASISDGNLHLDYVTSVLLTELFLFLYKNIRARNLLWGIVLTIAAYLAAGPAAILFAACACVYDFMHKTGRAIYSISFPLVSIACSAVAYLVAAEPSWAAALTPSFHYEPGLKMPSFHWMAWVSVPAVVALCGIRSRKVVLSVGVLSAAVTLASAPMVSGRLDSESHRESCEFELYAVNEQWDELISSCKGHKWSPGTANYLNLALAHKGMLAGNLLKYDNRGTKSLVQISDNSPAEPRVAMIMYAMGNVAVAQNIAFNSLMTPQGYVPSMLKMNARIELMRGSYDVADKYLSLLEKSLHYRAWARAQKVFLYDDSAVEADPVLGSGRLCFSNVEGFAMSQNPVDEVLKVLEADPDNEMTMQYALSYLLLSKDVARLQRFVEKYWGSPSLQALPVAAQEALLFLSAYPQKFAGAVPVSGEWCMEHGVTDGVLEHFKSFRQIRPTRDGKVPMSYKGTYWFYLVNTQT